MGRGSVRAKRLFFSCGGKGVFAPGLRSVTREQMNYRSMGTSYVLNLLNGIPDAR